MSRKFSFFSSVQSSRPVARWWRVQHTLLLAPAALIFSVACSSSPEAVGSGVKDGNGTGTGGESTGGEPGTGGDTPVIVGEAGATSAGGTGGTDDPEYECGNEELEPGELCDDGNTEDGDGCSADCTEQDPEFDCSTPGEPCVDTVVCGNSVLEGDEGCDDGNLADDDGCSSDCEVEDGFICTRPGRDCSPLSVCGNGERERGESCDDGQATPEDGDGCSATCQAEDGFFCSTPGTACVALDCGDGNRTPDEECDDNNEDNGDGCSATCEVEEGFRCSATGCQKICGDGIVLDGEQCDDGNRGSGDGCSAACLIEPFFDCSGEPSSCSSTIVCGNSSIEPGEICDPPGTDGCLAGCKSFAPDVGGETECGNGIIEAGESCDDGPTQDPPVDGDGCNAGCATETGWSCPRPGECFQLPRCGDGVLHTDLGEECDDGDDDPADGCDSCTVTDGWSCYGLGPSTCVFEECGDGNRTPSEECDDNNMMSGDGCSACVIEPGYVCPVDGEECIERCGDGDRVGDEECDDLNTDGGDGCSPGCRVEPGFSCPTEGMSCVEAVCGDGEEDPNEGCDDGNQIAGDGCGPTCQLEPSVTVGPDPVVNVSCGDGLVTSGEECDDGNLETGDGCSDTCEEEDGFTCTELIDLPDQVEMSVTYRDFKVALAPGGHPDFNFDWGDQTDGIAGDACTVANAATCGRLDNEGKPVGYDTLDSSVDGNHGDSRIRSKASFALWYRDSNPSMLSGYNGVIEMQRVDGETITLTQVADGDDAYTFESGGFSPLNGLGFGGSGNDSPTDCEDWLTDHEGNDGIVSYHKGCDCVDSGCYDNNYSFTTELRYFFQYQGGETLTFLGDDDVWVFINGKLAVDIGGLHQATSGRVVLGDDGRVNGADTDTDSDCSVHGGDLPDLGNCYTAAEAGDDFDTRFGLEKGEVYEIVLFHAERHSTGSNFNLTLDGFLAPRSYCAPICGDGVVQPGEACDDGENTNTDDDNDSNDVSGDCNESCTALAYCGDGKLQIGEQCDNGVNRDLYITDPEGDECAPGCVTPPTCGDGVVQAAYEQCDNGMANSDTSYGPGSCTTTCTLGGYCGDDIINGPSETCDDGVLNGTTYGSTSCGYDCQAGPRCGDGVRNGEEECDGSANCSANCTLDPYCGDGVVSQGESCDYGQFASTAYGGCTDMCEWGPGCGDGELNNVFEECDDGFTGNTGEYDACTASCTFGPRCGDAVVQDAEGEACDNGFNDDTYAFNDSSCGAGCQPVPYCGDGTVQSAFEVCDDGANNADDAYDGCTTTCEWGPYCGDGSVDGEEVCDDGADNVAYSADGEACGYDCQTAPYCGDGERNGPEQCDLGDDNTGDYGACNDDCTLAPYCGDGVVQKDEGEQCDAGPTGSLGCTVGCKTRGQLK